MSDVKLGQLAQPGSQRDAIHIAIAPVVAGMALEPGDHVGIGPDGTADRCGKAVGVVDPFLPIGPKAGERFYLLLYQNTVTGMRHEWMHPDFADAVKSPAVQSEMWIRKYADSIHVPYEALMHGAYAYLIDGMEELPVSMDFSDDFREEFWDHYFNVTGKRGSGSFFSCSC